MLHGCSQKILHDDVKIFVQANLLVNLYLSMSFIVGNLLCSIAPTLVSRSVDRGRANSQKSSRLNTLSVLPLERPEEFEIKY